MILIIEELIKPVEVKFISQACPICSTPHVSCNLSVCPQNEIVGPGFFWQLYCGPDGIDVYRGTEPTMQQAFEAAEKMKKLNDKMYE